MENYNSDSNNMEIFPKIEVDINQNNCEKSENLDILPLNELQVLYNNLLLRQLSLLNSSKFFENFN